MPKISFFFFFALTGDSGFALEPWMIVPFARDEEPEDDSPEARFNVDLVHDRCHVERAIGTLKERFRSEGQKV